MSARAEAQLRNDIVRRSLSLVEPTQSLDRREQQLIDAQQELLVFQRAEIARLREQVKDGRLPAPTRRRVVRALRKHSGWSYSEIGRALGFSTSQMHKDVTEDREDHQ